MIDGAEEQEHYPANIVPVWDKKAVGWKQWGDSLECLPCSN